MAPVTEYTGEIDQWLEQEAGIEEFDALQEQLDEEMCAAGSCSKKRMRHIYNERKRRILMNNLLDSLQSLLPNPYPRKDRCALLSDVIEHVQTLEEQARDLEARTVQITRAKVASRSSSCPTRLTDPARKLPGLSETPLSPNFVRNLHVQFMSSMHSGHCRRSNNSAGDESDNCVSSDGDKEEEVLITFTSPSGRGLLPHVLDLLQRTELRLIDFTLSARGEDDMLWYIHAQVPVRKELTTDQIKSLFS
ncbi:hypothetical protein KP509_09G089000 [Ceratopteris richardii]|uniref:BHLH domain-containing protein n=1 Tax=Ceratopteris richardii TaxID=49495 RepID=A0A8T2UCL7_CERRI|nr:hypothetical protein KP509_09G089000 [Ceratopteris richardii]